MDINLAETAKALAEPAKLAIEKLSSGCGRLYEPIHVRRMARAAADSSYIGAIGEKDVAALSEAAENRASYRLWRQEQNLRLIADRASQLFEEGVPSEAAAPPDEWVDEFTDQSKDASSDELRELWARLYVAETKAAGVVPRRVLRVVRDLDASLARSFTHFLACAITADDGRIVVLTFDGWINGSAVTNRSILELEDIGLIQLQTGTSKIGSGDYRLNQGRFVRLTFEGMTKWKVGWVRLTSAGIAIASVAERNVDEQYVRNFCAAAEAAGAKVEHLVNPSD